MAEHPNPTPVQNDSRETVIPVPAPQPIAVPKLPPRTPPLSGGPDAPNPLLDKLPLTKPTHERGENY